MNNPLLLLVKTSKFEEVLTGDYLELDILGRVNESKVKDIYSFHQKLFLPKWFLEQKGLLDPNLWRGRTFYLTYFPDYKEVGTQWSQEKYQQIFLAPQFSAEKEKEIATREQELARIINFF